MNYRTFLFALFLLGCATRANAAPITVFAGETIFFNFDLTGSTPAPPYNNINVSLQTDTSTVFDAADSETATWELWGGLNGSGSLFATLNLSGLGIGMGSAQLNDGIFSLKLVAGGTGSFVVNPVAWGSITFPSVIHSAQVSPTVVNATAVPVPEPASMLLLGTGLAGAGLRRWRQKRA